MNAQAETDSLLRDACLESLTTFAETMQPGYKAAAVHRLLAAKLEDCFHRRTRRLCLSMAPRHGKSRLTSIHFPAWALSRSPGLEILGASYSAELAETFSLGTKAVLASEACQSLFGPTLHPETNRSKSWNTLSGGSYFAAGVGGGMTGRGADLLILDDLFKSREDAGSAAQREAVWNWFTSTAMTRLSPDGVVIVIGTRWHEDDLIGRLTRPGRAEEFEALGLTGEAFEFLSLEALCENEQGDLLGRKYGEAAWPEKWPAHRLEAIRAQIGPSEFAALYQGRPSAIGGNLCDVRKIKVIDREDVPKGLQLVRGWDLALGTAAHSDHSCGALGGYDSASGKYFLVHMSRSKLAWLDLKRLIMDFGASEADGGVIAVETVAAWSAVADELRQAFAGRTGVRNFTPSKSKEARAQPWFNIIDAGLFHVVRGGWNAEFSHELSQFPNGVHDDQVDAVTVCFEAQRRKTLVMA